MKFVLYKLYFKDGHFKVAVSHVFMSGQDLEPCVLSLNEI